MKLTLFYKSKPVMGKVLGSSICLFDTGYQDLVLNNFLSGNKLPDPVHKD